jgi:hypothetical protein
MVLLLPLKYCLRNHVTEYLHIENSWESSFGVQNKAHACLVKFIDDKGAARDCEKN